MGKQYKIKVGNKTYNINLPKILGGKDSVPVSIGHGIKYKEQRKNQLEEVDRQLKNVGKSDMEQEVFDQDYTD